MANINPFYTDEVISEVKKEYNAHKNFNLLEILTPQGKQSFTNLKWTKKYEPMKHSYSTAKTPDFKELAELLKKITGKKITKIECRKYEKGDYTILYDKLPKHKRITFELDLNTIDEDCGGYTAYVQNGQEIVRRKPIENSLLIIRAKGLLSFVKYVNHHTRQPRIMIYGELN